MVQGDNRYAADVDHHINACVVITDTDYYMDEQGEYIVTQINIL